MESIPFDALDRIALELGALVVLCALQCVLLLYVVAMVWRRRVAKSLPAGASASSMSNGG